MNEPPIADREPIDFAGQDAGGIFEAIHRLRQLLGEKAERWSMTIPAWIEIRRAIDAHGMYLPPHVGQSVPPLYGMPVEVIPGPRIEVTLHAVGVMQSAQWTFATGEFVVNDWSKATIDVRIGTAKDGSAERT